MREIPSDHELREKCAVFGIHGAGSEAARVTFYGLWALQHRGQEGSGIVTSDGLFRKTAPAYADAAVLFPLAPDAFVADIPPITPAQSLAVSCCARWRWMAAWRGFILWLRRIRCGCWRRSLA